VWETSSAHPEKVLVVGLGQACLDHLGTLGAYPREDGKCELSGFHIQCGGPASTALVTLARLGVKTSFLGSISDDAFGVEITKGLKKERVDDTFLKIRRGYTSQFAFIAVTEGTGNRTVFWHRGSVPHLKPGEVDLSAFTGAKILHVDGLMVEVAQEAARQAKARGMKVIMDAGTMRAGSLELAALVDVVISSQRFAASLAGESAPVEKILYMLRELGPQEAVITLGPKGSWGRGGQDLIFQRAFPIEVKDTTGAGDVYHGAYIYGLLQGWKMRECMRFASAASALKCREIGARKGIPRLGQIMEFMSTTDE
jgi:ribokinase